MRNGDFGVEVTFRPEMGHSIMVKICFASLPVILCQVGGRPNVWHEWKHCKTERGKGVI